MHIINKISCIIVFINICFISLRLLKYLYGRKQIKIIAIEGNIGVGKTTLIDKLKRYKPISNNSVFVSEPVDIWSNTKDEDGKSIIDKYYEHKDEWAFPFQLYVYGTRMQRILETVKQMYKTNQTYMFLDRSLYTDKNVFEQMLYDDKYICKIQHTIYNLFDDIYNKYINNSKHMIIYLRCDPNIAYNRIKNRGREAEKSITIKYLKKLHMRHEKLMKEIINNNKNVLILDYNYEIDENTLFKTIARFISS